jgi:hypothetical protein
MFSASKAKNFNAKLINNIRMYSNHRNNGVVVRHMPAEYIKGTRFIMDPSIGPGIIFISIKDTSRTLV